MKKQIERSPLQIAIESRTDLERVQRLTSIVRTVPMQWTDSKLFAEADLSLILGFIEARYRVNTPDRIFIVQTMAPQISREMLEREGIKDMTSCFLVAVRSLLGEDFPPPTTEADASELLQLNRQFMKASEKIGLQIEAIYTNGKCDRTGREFRFEDWIDSPESPAACANEAETPIVASHPLSLPKEKWPGEEYARNAIIRLRQNPELQKNVSAFCRTIAEEQGVPEIATSLKKLLYESEYKQLWKLSPVT